MSETDTALVSRARGGDRAAFEELVRRTSRLVFARLYLDTGSADHAEDLLQETYLLACRSIRRLIDPAGFRPWLLSIAHNVLIDSLRKEQRRKRIFQGAESSLLSLPAKGLSPVELVQQNEIRQRVLAILRSMPEEYRLPLESALIWPEPITRPSASSLA